MSARRYAGRPNERGDRDKERAFTEQELRTLLYSEWPKGMEPEDRQQIEDVPRISALSGMRLAEVIMLGFEEVHDVFDFQQGKTCPLLARFLFARTWSRTFGDVPKARDRMLFHEGASLRDSGDRLGKCFNRFRKHLGVDDMRAGQRRSLVNFHSATRWFITQARHAGHAVETVKEVVGHVPGKKGSDVTFGAYTEGASEIQLRACVEAVKLPGRA